MKNQRGLFRAIERNNNMPPDTVEGGLCECLQTDCIKDVCSEGQSLFDIQKDHVTGKLLVMELLWGQHTCNGEE